MSSSSGKIILGILFALFEIVLFIPDLLLDLLTWFFHMLLEGAHLLFEALETALDFVIEHFLGTDLHQTQVIVFYIIIIILFYFGYRWAKKLPDRYRKVHNNALSFYGNCKVESKSYWQSLDVLTKAQWIGAALVSLIIWFFFGF